jgi:SulP family sulfate permease
VHSAATVIGRVILGRHVHIAADTSIRADEGSPFYIGDNSNIQDGVVMHALKSQWIRVGRENWAIYIGKHVSVAHQALVHGPCFIGDNCFIGFKAVIHNSTLGDHCYVGIGATVVGVKVPPFRYVPHGAVIDSEEKVQKLTSVTEQHLEFNFDVVEVNRGLAAAYSKLDTKNKNVISEKE